MEFEHLFSEIRVGPITVKNRICETTNSPGAGGPRSGGLIDDHYIANHLSKARGGSGWIGGETWLLNSPLPDCAVADYGVGGAALGVTPYLFPGYAEAAQRFTEAVHETGSVVIVQLTHLNNAFGASSIPSSELYDFVPHAMTEEHIEFVMATYAAGAEKALEAGADGIEIHCAHEALPHLFLSPATNRRNDDWGGNAAARSRFVVEVLRRVRSAVGTGMALGIRVNGCESRQGGYDVPEFRKMVSCIADAGFIDFLNIDVGHAWGRHAYVPPSYHGAAEHREIAKAVRSDVGSRVRILFAGGVRDPVLAEQLIAEGVCDLVGMTRAGIADPEFPIKAKAGRSDEIRRCIGCNRCIGESVHSRKPPQVKRPMCSVNPEIGNEIFWQENFLPTRSPRHVVVVGAGPAGLEASRLAALRGHRVTLLDRSPRVGGQLLLAARAPGRESFLDFVRFSENELRRLDVTVRLNCDVTKEMLEDLAPEALVCATGSRPRWPSELSVEEGCQVVQGWDVLGGGVDVGDVVAVYSEEDHFETPSVAEYLSSLGKKVTVFHKWAQLGAEIDRYSFGTIMQRLEMGEVSIVSGLRMESIGKDALSFVSAYSGASRTFEGFDTVVLVCGSVPDAHLYDQLRRSSYAGPMYLAGAAWLPRQLAESTQHGASIGLAI